jgi:chemotaxis response regulator CheB
MRFLILDGRPVWTSRLREALEGLPLVADCTLATTAEAALSLMEKSTPDMLVLGPGTRGLRGLDLLTAAAARLGVRVVPLPDAAATTPQDTLAALTALLDGTTPRARATATPRAILIGASTGGVEALHIVLQALPPDCPPVFIVQHMRPNLMQAFVEGLDRGCRATVVEAQDRQLARPGTVYVAPAGLRHLVVTDRGGLTCRLIADEPRAGHRPSVDVLFQSGAALSVPPVAALLTGMGRDGADGLLAIRRAGGATIAQDQASCTVFGMPRAAAEIGAARDILPLTQIGRTLMRHATAAPDRER